MLFSMVAPGYGMGINGSLATYSEEEITHCTPLSSTRLTTSGMCTSSNKMIELSGGLGERYC
ncbi:hypothetical protein I7I50_06130 [Histoplasma capsulatum G186AR]|uniref:Uncharacterized protein n=1 Tax=Ajellomyces capsulatus TaxID=5037 RepID=A0A8H7YXD8_AJECA|nr:hypothetical protein I7I52_10792 [Histoplasma capsulatum]QSS67135.1 hypothetical protein I7I50_06130 [Histoplasma capsulatum G186AR]